MQTCPPLSAVNRAAYDLLLFYRTIDKSRLSEYIWKLDNGTMQKIDNAVKISFDIDINDEKRNNNELYGKN